jgi:hypothetical protein
MKVEDVIEDLISIILMQEKEIDELREKVNRVNQYIDAYETLIKGE